MVISLLITDNEVVVRGSVFLYQGMSISTVFVNATVTDGDIKVQVVDVLLRVCVGEAVVIQIAFPLPDCIQ